MAKLADIAKRAGVSLSTASYAMSGKRAIGVETRRRVLAAVEELRFQPHAAARALASKRSRTVALSCPTRDSSLSTMALEIVISASRAAEHQGYALMVSTAPFDDERGSP